MSDSDSTDECSSPPPSGTTLLTTRELTIATGIVLVLLLVFLFFGQLNWTVAGELALHGEATEVVAVMQVAEIDVALVRAGQRAEVHLRAYPGTALPGRVAAVGDEAVSDAVGTVTVPVVLDLTTVEGVELRSGFTGNAEIIVARDRAGIVLWGRISRFVLQNWL